MFCTTGPTGVPRPRDETLVGRVVTTGEARVTHGFEGADGFRGADTPQRRRVLASGNPRT